MKTYCQKICHKISFLPTDFIRENIDLALAVCRWCFIYRQNKWKMMLVISVYFLQTLNTASEVWFFKKLRIKHDHESCAYSPIIPKCSLSKKYCSNGKSHWQNPFFSVFFFDRDNNLSNRSSASPPQLTFKDFSEGRIGEWAEAQPEGKETGFDNNVLYGFVQV